MSKGKGNLSYERLKRRIARRLGLPVESVDEGLMVSKGRAPRGKYTKRYSHGGSKVKGRRH